MRIKKSGYMGVVETVDNEYLGETHLFSKSDQQRYKKRRYRTVQEKARNIRRNLILEMVMKEPNRKWTYREIADEARQLPWFQENMPAYSVTTAHSDYLIIKKETRARREELAEVALVQQLDEVEEQIESILSDLASLGSLEDFFENEEPDVVAIAQFAKTKNTLLVALDRLMAKQARLLPIDLPKKVEIDSRHITFDAYLNVRKEYKDELGPNVIEGEYHVQDDE